MVQKRFRNEREGEEDGKNTWCMLAVASSSFMKCIDEAVDGDQGSVARRGDPSTQSLHQTDRSRREFVWDMANSSDLLYFPLVLQFLS